ncbi:O-antigen ligase [Vibrio chagasii]|nr:O-antigen ligase [Vibrio chagasii]CAH6811223.1 O-antigen ligase [Vibrio chagasii]CAH6973868.1 O-antigen ligase [Vibrio chagasii]CAH6991759.1 O-antigen ligase [Vibrio chagasii]CAH7088542.1 O-antigen ligase [Vibrio chagasii]
MTIRNNILQLLMLSPYLFAFSGMLIIPSGDKKMAIFLVIGALASLAYSKVNKLEIKEQLFLPYLYILILAALYTIFSYYTHGASSREMRILIASSIFLAVCPIMDINKKLLIYLLLMGSLTLFFNSFNYHFLMGYHRFTGYINPIPYATICALIASTAYSIILSNSNVKEKLVCVFTLLIVSYPLITSESRGVWLALALSLLIISAIHIKDTKKEAVRLTIRILILFSIVSFGSLVLLKGSIIETVKKTKFEISQIESGEFNNSIGLRLQMWLVAPKLVKDNLFFGNGDSHQLKVKQLYSRGEAPYSLYNFNPTHYHNQFLDKLVKSGIIGFIILSLVMIYPISISNHLSKREKMIVWGVFTVIFVASMSDVPLNHPQPLIVYLLILFPILSRYKRVTNG